MENSQRLKRPNPDRSGPIRNWSMMYRQPQAAAERKPPEHPGPAQSGATGFGDTVAGGVELGYRVIDEQIRLGQRVAQQINDRTYGSGAMAGDFREVVERILRYYGEFGTLWLELLSSFADTVAPSRQAAGAKTGSRSWTAVSLDVTSDQPAHVMLDLPEPCDNVSLSVYDLRAPAPACPPLTDVKLEPGRGGRGVVLHLRVPPGQPAGQYAGVVVDDRGGVRGTLTVRVGNHAKQPTSAPS